MGEYREEVRRRRHCGLTAMERSMSINSRPLHRSHESSYASLSRSFAEPLLTIEMERELAEAIALGDGDARDRFVRANFRLVVRIALGYVGHRIPVDDLIGEGAIGLIRAVDSFKPDRGVRFSTHASHWIKQSIRAALTNSSRLVRLPSHAIVLLRRWRRAEADLMRALGGISPPFDRVADRLGLTDVQRELVARAMMSEVNDNGHGDDGHLDFVAECGERPMAAVERSDTLQDLRTRMEQRLDQREKDLITLRFGLDGGSPLTLAETGRRLGITKEWTRELVARAVAKLGDEWVKSGSRAG
jgi:RNA polymerase primary sigma factor